MSRTAFASGTGVRDEADDVGIRAQLAGPSRRLRRLRLTAQGRRQACANSPPQRSGECAAGTARVAQKRNTRRLRCQTSDKMALPARFMLRFLSVRHLAVIDQLELEFEPGLNVLTGETGAGKSILVGAVGLLVGGRASADLVRTGEDAATVQAIFDRPDGARVIVRREISAQGRSRAFIDGALATSAALRELSGVPRRSARPARASGAARSRRRTSTCSTRSPASTAERAAVADGLRELAARCATSATGSQRAHREKRRARRVPDLPAGEIDRVAPTPGEDDELAASATGAGQRRPAAAAVRRRLRRPSTKATRRRCRRSAIVWKRVGELAAHRRALRAAPRRARRRQVAARGPRVLPALVRRGIDASPARLQEVEDRLALLERLKKKHGPTLDDVIDRSATAAAATSTILDARRPNGRLRSTRRSNGARRLSRRRRRALDAARRGGGYSSAAALERSLGDLAMARTRCEVRFTPAAVGGGVVGARASSRPSSTSRRTPARTPAAGAHRLGRRAVADHAGAEDAGLHRRAGQDADLRRGRRRHRRGSRGRRGGAAAGLAGAFQVLCITHLPQIAAHGATHFQIAKSVRQGAHADRRWRGSTPPTGKRRWRG